MLCYMGQRDLLLVMVFNIREDLLYLFAVLRHQQLLKPQDSLAEDLRHRKHIGPYGCLAGFCQLLDHIHRILRTWDGQNRCNHLADCGLIQKNRLVKRQLFF